MEISEITNGWKNFSSFIMDAFENGTDLNDDALAKIDSAAHPIFNEVSKDLIVAKAKKIMSYDIFDAHFEIFDKLPITWSYIYRTSISTVASEYGVSKY